MPAPFTWTQDTPDGPLKNHSLSRKLWEAAVANSMFMDHVMPADNFGKNKGDTHTLTRIHNITEPASAVLTEGIRIPEDEFSISTQSVTVQEMGRAVPYTSLARDLLWFNLDSPIQRKLRDQLRLVLDTQAAAAFKTAQVKYVPVAPTTNNVTFNGVAGAAADRNLLMFDIEEIRDLMFDTLHVPPLENDDYLGIFRTRALRGLKRDTAWEEWHKYTDPQAKFNGEVGRIEGVRFLEVNHSQALANIGTAAVLGEGVVFGEDGVVMAEALSPELRIGISQDFGRERAVAWYGLLGFAIVWDTGNAGEARIVHVTSL